MKYISEYIMNLQTHQQIWSRFIFNFKNNFNDGVDDVDVVDDDDDDDDDDEDGDDHVDIIWKDDDDNDDDDDDDDSCVYSNPPTPSLHVSSLTTPNFTPRRHIHK